MIGLSRVARGDVSPPVVQEYEFSPLPQPTGYVLISRSQWRDPIPYTVRPYNTQLDSDMWDKFICRQLTNINDILHDVTGWTYSAQCADHCLSYRCDMLQSLLTCAMPPADDEFVRTAIINAQ